MKAVQNFQEVSPVDGLIEAVRRGLADNVRELLAQGVDVNQANSTGECALSVAVYHEDQALIELLITAGAELSAHDQLQLGRQLTWSLRLNQPIADNLLPLANLRYQDERGSLLSAAFDQGEYGLAEQLITVFELPIKQLESNYLFHAIIEQKTDLEKLLRKYHIKLSKEEEDKLGQVLLTTIQARDDQRALSLIHSGAPIHSQDSQGHSALYYAASQGMISLVKTLNQRYSKLSQKDCAELSQKLYVAIENSDHGLVEAYSYLPLDFVQNLNQQGTPLDYAIKQGKINIIDILFKQQLLTTADKNKLITQSLSQAASSAQCDVVNYFCGESYGKYFTAQIQQTCLQNAIIKNQEKSIDCLIRAGLNANAINTDGQSLLALAMKQKNKNIIDCLIKSGAVLTEPEHEFYHQQLLTIVTDNDIKSCEELLKIMPDINWQGPEIQQIILTKIQQGQHELIDCLIQGGAELSRQDKTTLGRALVRAIERRDETTAENLINQGADLSATNNTGESLLIKSALAGLPHITELLLEKGMTVSSEDKQNLGHELLWAAGFEDQGAIEALLILGADLRAIDDAGENALYKTIHRGNIELTQCFAHRDVDFVAVLNCLNDQKLFSLRERLNQELTDEDNSRELLLSQVMMYQINLWQQAGEPPEKIQVFCSKYPNYLKDIHNNES